VTRCGASLCLLLTAVACRAPAPEPAAADRFPAPDGAQVRIDSLPVHRIVSTMQSATEWIVLLGAADLMVARTDYDRQPELAHLPSIGGGLDPSAEVIASLDPDVVLGWRIRASMDLQRTLAPFNIPVIAVEATDTGEVFTQLGVLARLVGREREADSLAATLRAELDAARASCVGDAESVVVILSTEPPVTSGAGTWMDQLLPAACFTNAFGDLTLPWPTISVEALVDRQPDWVLTSVGPTPGERVAALRAAPGWRDLDAVRNGRVLEIPGDLFSRAGPTMGEWVRAVREARQSVRGEG
jgi:ABC-type Fe3+-hydroxamate transport system substrate-binding protein